MPQSDFTSNSSTTATSGSHGNFLQQLQALLTPRRVGYTIAGAFAFVGAAAALDINSTLSAPQAPTYRTQNATVSTPASSDSATADSNSATSNVNASVNSTGNAANTVQLNVNGQDIAVPDNGTTQQTVTNSDGSQTTVNTSSNVSSQGNATNSNSTSFSLNVNSSSGGSTTQ